MNEFDNRENLDNDREMNEKDVITEINSPIAESENAEKADSAEEQSQKTSEETPTASAEYSPTNQYSEFGNQGDSSGEQFNSAQPTMDFSPLNEVKEEKVSNTGLRVFICILAAAMLITGCLAGGYLAGRSVNIHSNSTVNLAPKPDVEKVQADETIYNNLKESVVGVSAYGADGKSRSSGSGVIYSSDGYIITNDHIYESVPSAKFLITTYDGIEYEATYVAGDTRSDLAVLKINVSGLKAAEFGDSSALNVGEKVVAVGYPAGVHERPIMTSGLISSVGRRVTTSTTYSA
ncbi:MAG: trypsin-like peptidase domain-containing protein, partial [Oscillospiraceae bacterium]